MSQFIRALLRDYISGALAESLIWDTARATDFRCLCVAVNIFDKDHQGSARGSKPGALPTIQSMTKWLQDSFDPDLEFRQDVRSTFEIFVAMARTSQFKGCFNLHDKDKQLKVAPAEFIMIAYLIHKKKAKLTLKQLSEAIRKMRWNVRQIEKDIRMNSRVLKHMVSFVDSIKASSLKADAKSKPALEAYQAFYRVPGSKRSAEEEGEVEGSDDSSVDELASDSPPPKKSKGKRKRAKAEDSDNEDDEDYAPKRKAPPPTKVASRTPANSKTPKTQRPPTPSTSNTPSSPVPAPTRQPSPPPPPYIHHDRLAALRTMSFDSLPSHPPSIPSPLSGSQEWPNSVGLRLGPSFPVGPPPNLGQSFMERALANDPGYSHPGAGSYAAANSSRRASGPNASVPPDGDKGYGQRFNR